MRRSSDDQTGIAIIGMACRWPGADSPATFWSNLCHGVESITFFSDEQLLAAGADPALLANPNYVKAAAVLDGADTFDASFFGYSPREATLMDPQHRLFLEVAWETFEDAGYHPDSYTGVVGVVASGGGVVTSYLVAHPGHPALAGQTASVPHLGNDKDFLSTRVSYKLNLTGPSFTVQTACSTSLVAVHLACQSLRAGECDMVLAGAATVRIPQTSGYLAEKGNVHSLDGHCRAFDAGGQGTLFGSGVAAVLLKKVTDAVADGDHIYAVIKGAAVNNDGGRKVSYTAPSVIGQARAMVEALTLADVSPETLRYVECHATGTPVGDPLEIEALMRAFSQWTSRARFCAVGSVKTNIGHPEQAAGLAGLMKAALALRHRRIPPTLHFVTPNPAIDFETGPFYVNTGLGDWPADPYPRRAAVNSLGIGGTNAFVVLEEAPATPPSAASEEGRPVHVFTLSAKNAAALRAYADRVGAALDGNRDLDLADVCYTSNVSRSRLECRMAVTTDRIADLKAKLTAFATGAPDAPAISSGRGELRPTFLFPGQGSQYPEMAAGLYRAHPTFRDALDQCAAVLRPHLERPLLDVLFARDEDASLLDETGYTQPALFAVEYALARLWRAWGVTPGAVMGHSVGELAAACIAGVFDLEDGLRLVAERGRLMQGLTRPGSMAAVLAPEDAVRAVIDAVSGQVSVAALNGPQTTVISGERQAVSEVLARLAAQGFAGKALSVSRAFHSPLMDPILDAFEEAARRIDDRAPQIPLVSNLTGTALETSPGPRHWRDHVRQPVRFADGLRALQAMGCRVFLEIGPGTALLTLGRQTLSAAGSIWLPSLTRHAADWPTMSATLATLYREGVTVDWEQVHRGFSRRRIALPTYPFQRKRYWLDGVASAATRAPEGGVTTSHPLLGTRTTPTASEIRFECVYSLDRLPYLRDHRIGDAVVLPTAAAVEAVLAAGRACFGAGGLTLHDLVYHEALVLLDEEPCRVRLTVLRQGADRATFRLASPAADAAADEWRTHLSGTITVTAAAPPDGAAGPTPEHLNGQREIPGDRYYAALRAVGLNYGTAFRGIQRLWQGRGEARGDVCLPPEVARDGYGLHPALLDACLHIYPALIAEYGDFSQPLAQCDETFLPIGIERVRVYETPATKALTHATLRSGSRDKNTLVLDVRIFDRASKLLATVEGLSLRRLPARRVGRPSDRRLPDWLYRVRWDEQPRPPRPASVAMDEPGSWLILADGQGVGRALAERLEKRGDRCHVVSPGRRFGRTTGGRWTIDPVRSDHFRRLVREIAASTPPPLRGAVCLWALDTPPIEHMTVERLEKAESLGTGAALLLARALADARTEGAFAGRLWLVTRNAQPVGPSSPPIEAGQAPLWGLGRTVALEAPALWGGLIDLPPTTARNRPPPDAEVLAAELLEGDGEDQVAFRDGRRWVPRLTRLPANHDLGRPIRLRDDATYLITGGLGMLGLRIARWLVEGQGVRSLVLTGRSGAGTAAQAVIASLEARGARVQVIQANVSIEADVRRVVQAIRRLPPLRGVIHGAGVLDDGILAQMEWRKFTRATAPKIKGGWLLHHHTRRLKLDFFVLHSSLLSLTGSAGQANYTAGNAFVDALAGYRRGLGLPAMAINWGPWEESGMAVLSGTRGAAMWKARGVRYLPPDDGMQVFAHLIQQPTDHAVVTDTEWSTFVSQYPEPPHFYAEVASTGTNQRRDRGAVAAIRERFREARPEERRAVLVEFVRRQVMKELGFDEAIDTRQPLNELGLDSLMSVNVVNRLETALGVAVPVVKLIQGPSVEQLVDDLLPDVAKATGLGAETPGAPARPRPPDVVRTFVTAGDGWLVIPRPNPSAKARLVCFPFAGGGAATFRTWAESLHPALELVAVEPPGRASRIREASIWSLETFLAGLVPGLAPYLDRPAAFFGHCLGGLTAYETARVLRRDHGLTVAQLFVSASRPPHRLAHEGRFEENLLATMLKHDRFDPRRPAHEQPDDVFAAMIRHFNIGATDEFLARPELRRVLLPGVRADFAMAVGYRVTPEPPWAVPITCFAGLDDPYVPREEAVAWSQYTQTAFRLHLRPGSHFLVVDDRAFIVETINRELMDEWRPT